MILADPGVAIQTAWTTTAGTKYSAGLPGAGVNPEMVPEVQGRMLAPPFMWIAP